MPINRKESAPLPAELNMSLDPKRVPWDGTGFEQGTAYQDKPIILYSSSRENKDKLKANKARSSRKMRIQNKNKPLELQEGGIKTNDQLYEYIRLLLKKDIKKTRDRLRLAKHRKNKNATADIAKEEAEVEKLSKLLKDPRLQCTGLEQGSTNQDELLTLYLSQKEKLEADKTHNSKSMHIQNKNKPLELQEGGIKTNDQLYEYISYKLLEDLKLASKKVSRVRNSKYKNNGARVSSETSLLNKKYNWEQWEQNEWEKWKEETDKLEQRAKKALEELQRENEQQPPYTPNSSFQELSAESVLPPQDGRELWTQRDEPLLFSSQTQQFTEDYQVAEMQPPMQSSDQRQAWPTINYEFDLTNFSFQELSAGSVFPLQDTREPFGGDGSLIFSPQSDEQFPPVWWMQVEPGNQQQQTIPEPLSQRRDSSFSGSQSIVEPKIESQLAMLRKESQKIENKLIYFKRKNKDNLKALKEGRKNGTLDRKKRIDLATLEGTINELQREADLSAIDYQEKKYFAIKEKVESMREEPIPWDDQQPFETTNDEYLLYSNEFRFQPKNEGGALEEYGPLIFQTQSEQPLIHSEMQTRMRPNNQKKRKEFNEWEREQDKIKKNAEIKWKKWQKKWEREEQKRKQEEQNYQRDYRKRKREEHKNNKNKVRKNEH
jgi:hypothetical protein